jgi:hypothetical protein
MTTGVPVNITACSAARREEWEVMCRACDYATFFHTPVWADIFARASSGRMAPAAQKVEFSDGAAAIIPLVYKRYLGSRCRVFWSMPAFTFGGWVSPAPLTTAHARLLVDRLNTMADCIWRENPYDPLLGSIEIPLAADDFTQAVDLRQGYSVAQARSDYSHRRAVRRALERGVTIVEASRVDQWRDYFSLYEASRQRWKVKGFLRSREYPFSLFKAVFESPAEHRKLWLAQVNGRPVAGTLCFYWNRHAVSWNSAGAADFFKDYRPNDLLADHAIRHAAEAGCDWYDCNPSGGFKGVVEFKEHVGAQKLRSRVINKRSLTRRVAEFLTGRP